MRIGQQLGSYVRAGVAHGIGKQNKVREFSESIAPRTSG